MSKNVKLQKQKLFGKTAQPNANTEMRQKHMSHIKSQLMSMFGIKNRVTKGKLNASGKHIDKPDWTTGWLEYEPNPEAAIHEVGHLFLTKLGMSLAKSQNEMDAQFGFVNSHYGYMKQKRSYFEVMPMAMEQKIRRRLGLPASQKSVKAQGRARTSIEDGTVIAVRFCDKDLIRSSRNLDAKCLERLEMIDNGELVYDTKTGWVKSNSIDAKINRRARLQAKQSLKIKKAA